MIPPYLDLAARIHQELSDLERVVTRAERGIEAARHRPEDKDLYIGSAALNLHDFYAGLERIFQRIGATVDGDIPAGSDWHQQLLRQMARCVTCCQFHRLRNSSRLCQRIESTKGQRASSPGPMRLRPAKAARWPGILGVATSWGEVLT